ncbi:GLOBIN domain-containing protein [Mycena sanguinolenta]|uniref:GLOBIN domain-containing protein n=1 Tax=Mycena sanguinolenta TaxID=230812 RepID=A0A8H6XST1_9AGAR|nr:GLOBIN domain-containing protein [Mycena sanguinolenta]
MPPAISENPLEYPSYFMSPAATLLESTGPHSDDISLHDLIEAYNTFSIRIHSQIRVILKATSTPPALVSLRECSRQLSEALRRDLKRAREETAMSRPFPPLHSIFSTNELKSILKELLALGSAPCIPGPTSRRIWTLVVWIISVQNLPSEVLSPAKREVVCVLKRALEGEIGKDQAKLDALQASTQLLKQYPILFISPLLSIFSSILQDLIDDSADVRLQAINALGRFALAKINTLSTTVKSCHTSISTTLTDFIDTQTSKLKSLQSQLRLRNLVTEALTVRTPSHPANSPFWVVQLLASFVILLGDSVFSNPRAIKLIIQSLQQIAVHKQKVVMALHPYVWKCLVWVFSRLPAPTGNEEDIRDRVFQTLKQDLHGGIGLALILALLGSASNGGSYDTTDTVSKVLDVVKDMLSHSEQRIQAEGIALLTRLLYAPSPSANVQTYNVWVPQLFDGSIVQLKADNVIAAIRALPRLDPSHVRQLADSEILGHWEVLAHLWVQATNISLGSEFDKVRLGTPYLSVPEYKQNLLRGWQSLLLMPSDLTQGFSHLTTEERYTSEIAALICSFIVPTETVDAQVQRLTLVRKMWHTMTNVFQRDWLSLAAERVLVAVLKHRYDLAQEQIRNAWADLCSDLLSLGIPSAVGVVREQDERRMPAELQKQLWTLAVKSVQKADTPAPWMDLAYLLGIPFGAWRMTKTEVEIWNALLRASVSQNDVSPTVFVEQVLEDVEDASRLSESPEEFLTLLCLVDLTDTDQLPHALTSTVDKVICDLYPQQALAFESTSLQIIRQLRDVILSAPSSLALPLLLALQDSICKWLEDDDSVLDGDVRTEVTRCLFVTPLSTISDLQPTGQNLISLSRFLGTIADANAFESFWRVTYHGREEFYHLYPESIKTSLKAFADVYGGSLAADLSMENHSQMEGSVVLDSQPSQPMPSSSYDYDADDSKYLFETDTIGMGTTHFMDVDEQENSASTVRPSSPSIHLLRAPPRTVASAALDQLQEYSSRFEESSVPLSMNSSRSSHSSATVQRRSPRVLSQASYIRSGSSKRRAELDDSPSSSKRLKTSSHSSFRWTESSNAIAGPSRLPAQSISEPVTRRESPVLSNHAVSQPVPHGKRKEIRRLILDYVEIPIHERSPGRHQKFSLPTPSPSLRPRAPRHSRAVDHEEEEDYASWENGLSISEVKEAQHAFAGHPLSHKGNLEPRSNNPSSSGSRRSQTAPVPLREKHPPPLRRTKTSARLHALEHAYAVVADDASQTPVQDLVQATRLVHKIGAALNEQMSRTLDRS